MIHRIAFGVSLAFFVLSIGFGLYAWRQFSHAADAVKVIALPVTFLVCSIGFTSSSLMAEVAVRRIKWAWWLILANYLFMVLLLTLAIISFMPLMAKLR